MRHVSLALLGLLSLHCYSEDLCKRNDLSNKEIAQCMDKSLAAIEPAVIQLTTITAGMLLPEQPKNKDDPSAWCILAKKLERSVEKADAPAEDRAQYWRAMTSCLIAELDLRTWKKLYFKIQLGKRKP